MNGLFYFFLLPGEGQDFLFLFSRSLIDGVRSCAGSFDQLRIPCRNVYSLFSQSFFRLRRDTKTIYVCYGHIHDCNHYERKQQADQGEPGISGIPLFHDTPLQRSRDIQQQAL